MSFKDYKKPKIHSFEKLQFWAYFLVGFNKRSTELTPKSQAAKKKAAKTTKDSDSKKKKHSVFKLECISSPN
jgi:hypothetical protein